LIQVKKHPALIKIPFAYMQGLYAAPHRKAFGGQANILRRSLEPPLAQPRRVVTAVTFRALNGNSNVYEERSAHWQGLVHRIARFLGVSSLDPNGRTELYSRAGPPLLPRIRRGNGCPDRLLALFRGGPARLLRTGALGRFCLLGSSLPALLLAARAACSPPASKFKLSHA
jgi:hypothetical protein